MSFFPICVIFLAYVSSKTRYQVYEKNDSISNALQMNGKRTQSGLKRF
jgi:hypothetical protein